MAGAELELKLSSDGSVPSKKLCIRSCKFDPSGTGAGGTGRTGHEDATDGGAIAQAGKSSVTNNSDVAKSDFVCMALGLQLGAPAVLDHERGMFLFDYFGRGGNCDFSFMQLQRVHLVPAVQGQPAG